MAPSHPKLVYPRSDGSPTTWPEPSSEKSTGWFVQLETGSAKHALYGEKVGKYIAEEVLGLRGLPKPKIDLPKGYALWVHKKPQRDNRIREDVYLYGSTHVTKFRSPQEFMPHAKWLFDESKSIKDHSECECLYNKRSNLAKAKSASASASVPAKRLGESRDPRSAPDPKKSRPVELAEDLDAVVPERAIDETTQRRFRKGELVFFRIPTISPPKNDDNLPEITHWPGLIAAITQSPVMDANGTSNLKLRKFEHKIRPLGMFANDHPVVRDTSAILPFAVSSELLGGTDGWNRIGKEINRVLSAGVNREAQVDIPTPADLEGTKLEERWKRRWGARIRFTDLPQNWDAAVVRLGVALRMARNIASCWSQTDNFEILPNGSLLTQADKDAIVNRKKSLYQGLWYQGERLWTDDVVRVRKRRTDIPTDSLSPPGSGSQERAVFLRIRLIALENQTPDGDNSKEMWRCMIYGDLYELTDTPAPDPPAWNPPKGLYYRRINPESCEVTLDIFDIAGRAYPDLLEKDSDWFYDPNAPPEARSGSVPAGDAVREIMGLQPTTNASQCNEWKEDLYVMVRQATADMEGRVREHYARMLAKAMGFKNTPGTNGQAPDSRASTTTPTPQLKESRGPTSTPPASDALPSSSKTPIFQCNPADVTIYPSPGNRLQSPAITPSAALKPALDVAAEHLRAGRTVAFPTETVYGLGAHSLDPNAVAKVYAIKNRPSDNPLIMHISTLDMLQRLLPPGYHLTALYLALIDAFWPGPLTLLFPSANPPPAPAPQTNAIRMPNHPLALALIAAADLPVSAPSANSSGRPSPTRAAHVAHDLDGKDGLGCILDGGPCGVGVESTVVDALAWKQGGGGSVNVLRPGGLGVEDVARVVRAVDAEFGGETQVLVHGKPWKQGSIGGGAVAKVADSDLPPSTPGMKYRHYSPAIPVHLLLPSNVFPRPAVTGPTTDPVGVVKALAGEKKRIGLLHFDASPLANALASLPAATAGQAEGQAEGVQLERRSLGKDAASAAQHLFDGMLALEEAGVEAILIEGCADDGLGLAVMERVGKAVGGGGVSGNLGNGQVSTPGAEGRYWVEV